MVRVARDSAEARLLEVAERLVPRTEAVDAAVTQYLSERRGRGAWPESFADSASATNVRSDSTHLAHSPPWRVTDRRCSP